MRMQTVTAHLRKIELPRVQTQDIHRELEDRKRIVLRIKHSLKTYFRFLDSIGDNPQIFWTDYEIDFEKQLRDFTFEELLIVEKSWLKELEWTRSLLRERR